MVSEAITLKYRPIAFDEVVGHDAVLQSLKASVKKHHAFIFTGPSGVGKTTLARIIAHHLGCDKQNILEVDAATCTGIDDMRLVQDALQFKPLGKNKLKFVIVDEAHALSRQAWQSLLKIVEEPPAHAYWCFCTTEPGKVPPTIVTRCLAYNLNKVSKDDLFELLERVCEREQLELDEEIIWLAVDEANGSPRQALANLQQVSSFTKKTIKKAYKALGKVEPDSKEVVDLCRALANQCDWSEAVKLVQKIPAGSPEGVRHVVADYFCKIAMSESPKKARFGLAVLSCFADPYPPGNSPAPLLLSLGELLLGD